MANIPLFQPSRLTRWTPLNRYSPAEKARLEDYFLLLLASKKEMAHMGRRHFLTTLKEAYPTCFEMFTNNSRAEFYVLQTMFEPMVTFYVQHRVPGMYGIIEENLATIPFLNIWEMLEEDVRRVVMQKMLSTKNCYADLTTLEGISNHYFDGELDLAALRRFIVRPSLQQLAFDQLVQKFVDGKGHEMKFEYMPCDSLVETLKIAVDVAAEMTIDRIVYQKTNMNYVSPVPKTGEKEKYDSLISQLKYMENPKAFPTWEMTTMFFSLGEDLLSVFWSWNVPKLDAQMRQVYGETGNPIKSFYYRPWLRNTFFRIGAKNEAKCKTFDGLVQYGQQYLDPEGQNHRSFTLVETKPKQLTAQLAKALAATKTPLKTKTPAAAAKAPPKATPKAAAAKAPLKKKR